LSADSPSRVIVIGTSMGGVEALLELVLGLPKELGAALFIVQHVSSSHDSLLADILGRNSALPVHWAREGERIEAGQIVVAPPGLHLRLGAERVSLDRGARHNGFRPAIDPVFLSAAHHFGPRAVGVLLTGALSDGVAGLMAIRGAGGVAIVQDPKDAYYPELPERAIETAGADHILPVRQIPPLLVSLAAEPPPAPGSWKTPPNDAAVVEAQAQTGTTFGCPECGGVLVQVQQRPLVYRCEVGHAYGGEELLEHQSEAVEAALWTAVRTFREQAVLAQRMARAERANAQEDQAQRFEDRAEVATRHAAALLKLLESLKS
jgi:two-component system chemotaxis response regulator CheB